MEQRGETYGPAPHGDGASAPPIEREVATRSAAERAEREAAEREAKAHAGSAVPPPGERPVAVPSDRAGTHEPNPEDLRDLRLLRTRDLVTEIAKKASQLARAELALAKAEGKEDLRAEVKMAGGLGVAGVCALLGLETLLVAVAFAFQESGLLPGWLAAIAIAVVVLAAGAGAGLWGWAKRVPRPLATTRRSIQENVRWARDRIA